MKEGLRSSTLTQREKIVADSSRKNGRQKRVSSKFAGDLVSGSDTDISICSQEIKAENKEIQCLKNTDFGANVGAIFDDNAEVYSDNKVVNNFGKGRRGRKRKNVESSKEWNDGDSGTGKMIDSPIYMNDLHYAEDLATSSPEKKVSEDGCGNKHVKSICGDVGVEVYVKPIPVCDDFKESANCDTNKKEILLKLKESDRVEGLVFSSPERKIEERCGNEHVECKSDVHDVGVEGSVNSNGDVDANAKNCESITMVDKSRRGRKRKNAENLMKGDVVNVGGVKEAEGSPLISNCVFSAGDSSIQTQERKIEGDDSAPEHMECSEDACTLVDVGANANGDDNVDTLELVKQQQGRRKDPESIKNDDIDIRTGAEKERQPPSISNCMVYSRNSVSSNPEGKVKTKHEDIKCSKDVDAGILADGSPNTNEGKQKPAKGRRGRKRKEIERSDSNKDDGDGRKKVKDGGMQASGRVLRSRIVLATSGGEKVVDVGGKIKKETDCLDMERIDAEKGKIKGRRGRPPKVQGKNMESVVIQKDKLKIKGFKKIRDSKSQKVQKKQGASEAITDGKQIVMGFNINSDQAKVQDTIYGSNSSLGKTNTGKQKITGKDNRKEEMGRRQQQQLVREQIIGMLMNAGWTIDYRPRQNKDYRDAVYVDLEGRGYWSVTLAYYKLKEKVGKGDADSKTVAAFTPIPEDVLSKLFRVRKDKDTKLKGGGKNGSKNGKIITGKKSSNNKYSTKSIDSLKHKGKLSSVSKAGDKSSKIRMRGDMSDCEQDDFAGSSHRGRPRSNREIRKGKRPCALLARSSTKGLDPDSGNFVPYNGKRSLLSWMNDLGTVPSGAKVKYMDSERTDILLEGKITRDGFLCGCCNEIVSISDLSSHAGAGVLHDSHPLNNIYLGSGISLLQCLTDSWSKQEEFDKIGFCFVDVDGDDPNDDTCNICADGGDLICCDGCPSTFHQSCLDIEKFPSGDWYCTFCSCKFCVKIGGNVSQWDDSNGQLLSELLTCSLCEEKFHQLCIPGKEVVKVNSSCLSFCGKKCQELFERLRALLGVKHEMTDGFSWSLLQHCDVGQDAASHKIECNAKLAVAFSVLDECFCPIIDQRSGINMIHNVVYSCGSNFSRLSYSGFFTFILERGDEIISAASIRIHGNQLAEMPFIGTRHIYRRQGMCRRLLDAIELALCSLDVEKLVIPAISELHQTWTSVFGFKPLEDSKKQETRHMSMIMFPGTDMLQKSMLQDRCSKGNMILAAGAASTALSQTVHEAPHNSDLGFSSGSYPNASPEIIVQCASEINDETVAAESSLHPPDSFNDMSSTSGSACDVLKLGGYQTHEMTKCPNSIDGVATMLLDKKIVECNSKLNHHSVGGAESKSISVSHVVSDTSNCKEKPFHATGEGKEVVDVEQKEDLFLKHDCISLAEGTFHTHSLKDDLVHGFEGSEDCPMYSYAEYGIQSNNSHGGILDANCSSPQRRQKAAHDMDPSFPGDANPNLSSQRDVLATREQACMMEQLSCPTASFPNAITGPNLDGSCMSNGLCKFVDSQRRAGVEASSLTFPVGVNHDTSCEAIHKLKEEAIAAESNSHFFEDDTPSEGPQLCCKSSGQTESGSQADPSIISQGGSKSLCNTSPIPGVTRPRKISPDLCLA